MSKKKPVDIERHAEGTVKLRTFAVFLLEENLFRWSTNNIVLVIFHQGKTTTNDTRLIDCKMYRKSYCYYYLFYILLALKSNDCINNVLPFNFLS